MAEERIKEKGKEFTFKFGNVAVFKNNADVPFIVVKKTVDGVPVYKSLYNYTYISTPMGYKIDFTGDDITIKVIIVEKKEGLFFEINGEENEEFDEICLTFFKEKTDTVYGLPTFNIRDIKNIKEYFCPEQKLAFFLQGKYYFENKNIYDYSVMVSDLIFIYIKQKKAMFLLRFIEKSEEFLSLPEKNIEKITKYEDYNFFLRVKNPERDRILNYMDEEGVFLKGIVIEANGFNLAKIKTELYEVHSLGMECIYALKKEVSLLFADRYFDKGAYKDFIEDKDRKIKVLLNTKERIRSYLVCVRKYLDAGADGIYFDDDFSKKEITEIHKGLKSIIEEYPKITVFHSKLSEHYTDFGYYIIKNKQVIDNFRKIKNYYTQSGELYIGQEEEQSLFSDKRKNKKYGDTYKKSNLFPVNIKKVDF